MDDLDLLKGYVEDGDQEAFAQLVGRHGGWLYSAARRQLRDGHLAEDVTQAVFLLLSRRAGRLRGYRRLSGWLFVTLGFCVKQAKGKEAAVKRREQEAASMRPESVEQAPWDDIAPLLETVVGRLGKADRDAVLLRFYEQKPLAEVGRLMGVSEEAARKRVDRAVEKLRGMLEKQGVTGTSAGLSAVLAGNVVQEVPARVVPARVVEGAMSAVGGGGSAVAEGIAHGALKMMVMAKVKVVAATAVLVLALVGAAWAAGEADRKASKGSATAGRPAATWPAGKDRQITVEARCLVFDGADLGAVKSLVAPNADLDAKTVSQILALSQQDMSTAMMTPPRITVYDGEQASVAAPFRAGYGEGVPADAPIVAGKPVQSNCDMSAKIGVDKRSVDLAMKLDVMMVVEPAKPGAAGASTWKRISLDGKLAILNGWTRVAGMQTEAIGGGRERLSFVLIRPVIITRRVDAAGATKRLRLVPEVSPNGASCDRLTLDAASGAYRATAFVSVGASFPLRTKEGQTLFSAKLLQGDDEYLVIDVSQGNAVERIELQRDKAEEVEVAGRRYEMMFASEYIAPAGPDTTADAMIEVTVRP